MVKIGFTEGAVEDRIKALQTGSPDRLVLETIVEGDRPRLEALHQHAAPHHVRGEWFSLTPDDVQALLRHPDVTVSRWHKGGWSTQREATAAFSAIISQAQANGLLPGQPLPDEHREALAWLLGGHPRVRDLWSEKISYFTFRERWGRPGRFGFVLVDVTGFERPFSMTACLTGVERLPVLVSEEEIRANPFAGLVS